MDVDEQTFCRYLCRCWFQEELTAMSTLEMKVNAAMIKTVPSVRTSFPSHSIGIQNTYGRSAQLGSAVRARFVQPRQDNHL